MDVVQGSAMLAAGLCMGLGAIGSAIGEGHGAGSALQGIARQPAVRDELVRNMLIGQAIAETPGIFALVVAFLFIFSAAPGQDWTEAAAFLGAGLSIGIGALGSAVGSGTIAGKALTASGRNPARSGPSLRMMLVAQALCQTTVVFALVISLILWVQRGTYAAGALVEDIPRVGALLGAGACMGFGAVGPALGTGDVGGVAAQVVALRPEAETQMTRAFFVGAAVSQTTSIYALVVALILVFWAAA